MSKFYMLLKNNFIDFDKLLIEKYNLLGLDEIELVILIKLNNLLNSGKKFSIEYLSNNMTVKEDVIREKLVSLINNQFITLKLVNKNEIYSLDDTFKRLSDLLDNEEVEENMEENNSLLAIIVSLLESEFKKILSPLELELVHKWVYEDKFSYDKINNAVLEALKLKKKSIQSVDLLLNKKDNNQTSSTNTGIQDLFNQVYGKIK